MIIFISFFCFDLQYPGARKGWKVTIHCVFESFVGPESRGSKSRLAKAAGAEPSGLMGDEQFHAGAARSTFQILELLCSQDPLSRQFSRPPNDSIRISVRMTTCGQKPADHKPSIPCH